MPVERTSAASTGQRLMWLLERYRGADGALTVFSAYRLRGPLRVPDLTAAVCALTERHEGLRTTFTGVGADLTQHVHTPEPVPDSLIRVVDCAPGEVAGLVEWEYHRRFELAREWPLRCRVFRVAPDEHVLTLAVHHIVTDGWSTAVIADDLQTHYAIRIGAAATPSEPPTWQLADFTDWQNRRRDEGALTEKVAWWQRTLGDGQPVPLPPVLDHPAASAEQGMLRYDMPAAFAALLRDLATRERSTLFAVLTGAFAGYLGALTGAERVILPAVFADRSNLRVRRTVGFLVNMLLLPIDVSGNDFPALLRGARTVVFGAIARQEVPYHLVPMPRGAAARRRHPELLFEYGSIDVEYLDVPGKTLTLPGLAVEPYEDVPFSTTPFAAEFHFGDVADGLGVKCLYSVDRTNRAALIEFLDGFVAHVEAAARAAYGPATAPPH
ncbi:condensation domain-containing protein [Nocardia sp. NPDC004068]|uniref:condensation domain-containing protein n=1 Tax=Nocardia sp. NPDC004068 TaxID=3364303 RepID=UPI0036A63AC2